MDVVSEQGIVLCKNHFEKSLSYLKSTPSKLWKCKISDKNENPKIANQKTLLWGVFTLKLEKSYNVVFEISTLAYVKIQNFRQKKV